MKHITPVSLKSYQSYFDSDARNQVLQRAVMTNGILSASRNPQVVARDKNLWSYEIPTGAIRDQKRTGTCWLMASLAMAEKTINQRLKCEPIELSKSYLYFYDKLEMANAYWQNIIDTRDEPLDSRHVQSILHSKQSDGGYWSEAIDLIEKYGVVPKSVMPDVTDSEDSTYINPILNEKLAFGAKQLRETDDPQAVKEQLMAELYHILALSFGVPPSEFAFDFTPKKGDDDEDEKSSSRKKLFSGSKKSDDEDIASNTVNDRPKFASKGKVVPMKQTSRGLEVVVIRPESMEDASEITDTLLSGKAVVLNLEGIHVDVAQRVIDYSAGSCYAIRGNLQKITNYIFLVTPPNVDISGDIPEIVAGGIDLTSFKNNDTKF